MRFEKWHEKCLKNTINEDMPELDIPDDSKHTVQTELIHKACTEPTNTPEFPWNNQYLLENRLCFLKGLKKKRHQVLRSC